MATQLQIRRGTSTQVAAFTGAEGEIVVNTTNDSVHVNDGSTQGGFELARVDGSNWAITNAISTTNNISFGDNDKAIFGAGSDLQIFHDGSNSHITEGGTGDLIIRGANIEIQTGGGNRYFRGASNAARLYHTNNEKLTTTAAGINVTGTVTADGLTVTTLTAGAFTSNGIDDNGNATAITIDASENVGIGTSNATPSNGEGMCLGSGSTITRLDIRNSTTGDATGDGTSLQLNGNNFTIENREAGYVAFATSLTERMRINAAGYVNPNANVALTNAPDTQGLHFGWNYSNHAGESLIVFNRGAGSTGGLTFVDNSSSGTHDEVMRLEGGNVLVGKTSTSLADVGHNFSPSGFSFHTRDGGEVAYFNRKTSDGGIVNFYKDSSAVGSIGSVAGVSAFIHGGAGYSGVTFGNDEILPCDNAGATRDNAIDLGDSSGRFKDLYLSGGVYLGGTGSANYLDDYEQGSWTSTTTGITGANVTAANYTKIGQLVSCDMRVTWTGSTNDSTALTFSLPFTANNPGGASRTGIVFYQGTSILGGNAISAHVSVGGTVVSFYNTGGGTFRSILASDVNGSYDWLVSFSYFTDS